MLGEGEQGNVLLEGIGKEGLEPEATGPAARDDPLGACVEGSREVER